VFGICIDLTTYCFAGCQVILWNTYAVLGLIDEDDMYHLFDPVVHFVAFSVSDLGLIYDFTSFLHLFCTPLCVLPSACIYSRKFPEISTFFAENFPLIQTFQIIVYLLTSSLFVGLYSTSGLQ